MSAFDGEAGARDALFLIAEMTFDAADGLNRYADQAGLGILSYQNIDAHHRGAYGHAAACSLQILTELFGEDAALQIYDIALDSGGNFTGVIRYCWGFEPYGVPARPSLR
jgi:hypothetical protein